MLEFIMDGKNVINEDLYEVELKDCYAIYVNLNQQGDFQLFRRNNMNEWFVEKKEGLFLHQSLQEYNMEKFIEYIKEKNITDDSFFIRIYENEENFRMVIMDGTPQYIHNFANIEFQRLKDSIKRQIADVEMQERELESVDIISKDVINVLKLITAQNNDGKNANILLSTVQSLLDLYPLTEITDYPEGAEDWVEVPEMSVETGEKVYVNQRCPLIIKIVEPDGNIRYINHKAILFKDDDGKIYADGELSDMEIQLPYVFNGPTIEKKPEGRENTMYELNENN